MKLKFVPAGAEGARKIAPRLREADRRECETVTGKPVEETLPAAVVSSRFAYTMHFEDDPEPFAVFGCGDHPEVAGLGVVWFLGTPDILHARKAIFEVAPRFLRAFGRFYPKGLTNYIDSRNTLHIKWIKALGFTVSETKSRMFNGVAFYPIYHRGTNV